MEDKLRALVEKIETSQKLPDPVKDRLYETIRMGLQSMVWPVLMDYLPKDQLDYYTKNPQLLTTSVYLKLLNDAIAINDGEALGKMERAMEGLLSDIDAALVKEV